MSVIKLRMLHELGGCVFRYYRYFHFNFALFQAISLLDMLYYEGGIVDR